MYLWWVFFHVLAAFLFVLSHGAAAAVALTLRRQREPDRIRALLVLSSSTMVVMYVSLLATLATGINVGFKGHWWGQSWIWIALVLLVIIGMSMSILGSNYFNQVRESVGMPPTRGGEKNANQKPATPEELDALLRSKRPVAVSVIGIAGLVAILYLMVLKPF